jgi:hypothetical protein
VGRRVGLAALVGESDGLTEVGTIYNNFANYMVRIISDVHVS